MVLMPDRGDNRPDVDANSECFECDLTNVFVPPAVSWLTPKEEGFVKEVFRNESVRDYWARVGAAAGDRRPGGSKPLYEQCNMPGHLNAFLAKTLERKRAAQRLDAEGAGLRAPFHPGLFVILRGDSFLRMTFSGIVRTMSRNASVVEKAAYDNMHRKADRLLCCQGYGGDGTELEFTGCTMEYQMVDYQLQKQHVRGKLEQGQTCILWSYRAKMSRDVGFLQQWLSGPAYEASAPDMVVVNGGLHYHDWGREHPSFGPEWDEAVASYKEALSNPKGSSTILVAVASSCNTWHVWGPQRDAYEKMRQSVQSWEPAEVRRRVSYIDFHSLVGVDSCGFAHNFPAEEFWPIEKDSCGNNFVGADVHLNGGAYLHLGELLGFTLYQGKRRCDPEPWKPADSGPWKTDASDAQRISGYISRTISTRHRPAGANDDGLAALKPEQRGALAADAVPEERFLDTLGRMNLREEEAEEDDAEEEGAFYERED